jgi:NADPH2:quinone reductase
MNTTTPQRGLQLRSLIKPSGELELALRSVEVPPPQPNEVVVRVQAAPINPSDIGLLFGAADIETLTVTGSGAQAKATAHVPERALRAMAGRMGQALPVGNEGAGVVIAAGSSAAAQALLGKTVALLGGAMYAQYRTIQEDQCLVLPPGTTPAEGASCFVNPLTALGMTETMRREGHKALVHTAAASNLGQMLNRICIKDGIALVNIVRKPEQEQLLRKAGAKHVCNSAVPTFIDDLTQALIDTGATIAFDATGGGKLAGQILSCMEAALVKQAKEYSRYGSSTHKQVYLYGGLDTSPTELSRGSIGMAWGLGGWLLMPFLQRIGPQAAQALRQRVANEIKTTFASHYSREISLPEALQRDVILDYCKRATGEKFLINPNRGLTA